MPPFEPAYLRLLPSGELHARAEAAREHLTACDLCARRCGMNRFEHLGFCRTGPLAWVASFGPHHGEERPLSGRSGSGTVFFSRCNLRCIFCQNHTISQRYAGRTMTAAELAGVFLALQEEGCHNLNLVSPTHVVAAILPALALAAEKGLRLPIVYNTGGYDSPEAIELLDGIVDIYMPDMKYDDAAVSRQLSHAAVYPQANRQTVRAMHRQVGDLVVNSSGLAERGLLVRHLVLPGGLAGTEGVVRFLASEISRGTYLNLMDQYRPAYLARGHPLLKQPLQRQEFQTAAEMARHAGLHRLSGITVP
ncbi:MAG: radical SAM protein [Chloroflexi bacterium]|nr:radical SAM protein [Chloroflexota bacterium]